MVELLAPAGSFDSLRGAVNAGCDAVYIGGTKFGARAYADNPDTQLMKRCLDFCHIRDKKLYLTINTLLKGQELEEELYDYLLPLYEEGLDAAIIQDPGVMAFVNKAFPDLPIHISTQASVVTADGAYRLKSLYPSITRVVPARELSIEELTRFKTSSDLELEIFVHGALCYSYSGQCLMSSMIGGRSGNRGRCAQPCRKLYNDRYLLSLKDNCLLTDLNRLLDIDIDSFKIEGRMKSPEYTAGVVAVYRDYIDRYYATGGQVEKSRAYSSFIDMGLNMLQELYNRGGFNKGYLLQHNGPDMMCFDRPNHSGLKVGSVINTKGREAIIKLDSGVANGDVLEIRDNRSGLKVYEYTVGQAADAGSFISCLTMKGTSAYKNQEVYRTRNNSLLTDIRSSYLDIDSKIDISLIFDAEIDQPMHLRAIYNKDDRIFADAYGPSVEAASNHPTDRDQISKQLNKTGDTVFTVKNITINSSPMAFLPVKFLNELRRKALADLEEALVKSYQRSLDQTSHPSFNKQETKTSATDRLLYVSVQNDQQLDKVLTYDHISRIYYNMDGYDMFKLRQAMTRTIEAGKEFYLALPYICRYKDFDRVQEIIKELGSACGYMARNQEELYLLEQEGISAIALDYNLYNMNRAAASAYPYHITLPRELNFKELQDLDVNDSEMIIYGYQPVMFSAQCVYKNTYGKCRTADSPSFISITDELKHSFMVKPQCSFCTNIIYNEACLNLLDSIDEIYSELGCCCRMDFTDESEEEIASLIEEAYIRSAQRKRNFTREHFNRGIM